MPSEICFQKFNSIQHCSTCDGEVPAREMAMVWKLSSGKEIYCGKACYPEELHAVMAARYSNAHYSKEVMKS